MYQLTINRPLETRRAASKRKSVSLATTPPARQRIAARLARFGQTELALQREPRTPQGAGPAPAKVLSARVNAKRPT